MGVSRATLREAMRSFEGQGMIRRRQGVGTFVVAKVPVLDSGLEVLESIETLAERNKLSVNMGELQVQQVEADAEDAQALNVPVGTDLTRVARVIYTENRPIAYLVDTLPADILPMVEVESGFTGSVLDLLLQRGDPKLTQSRTDIRAVGASQEVARALQIQRDDVLLHFVAVSLFERWPCGGLFVQLFPAWLFPLPCHPEGRLAMKRAENRDGQAREESDSSNSCSPIPVLYSLFSSYSGGKNA